MYTPRRVAVLWGVWLTGQAIAQVPEPKAVIAAPTRVAMGDLVVLDATGSTGTGYAWTVVGSRKTWLEIEGGRRCVFASGRPGKVTFVLAVASGDRVALACHEIEVTASSPGPHPEPTPGPQPGPTPGPDDGTSPPELPVGRFDLARRAYRWALAHVALEAPRRADTARRLAEAFRQVKRAIEAKELSEPAAILEAARQRHQEILGAERDAWRPWGTQLAEALAALDREGRLATATDYADAWGEVALGLEAVGQPTTGRQTPAR